MLQRYALPFYNIGQFLEATYDVANFSDHKDSDLFDQEVIASIRTELQNAIEIFAICGLKLSILASKELINQPDEYFTVYNIKNKFAELSKRIEDELRSTEFYLCF